MSRGADALRTGLRGLGQLLLTVGFVLLLFVVYELYVTDLLAGQAQEELSDELREEWDGATPAPITPEVGEPFAFLHVPGLGAGWNRAIVEGTGADELAQGPGHYVGTALPGEQGNFAVAGHRVGRGSPFLDLDQLRPGDPIVVETSDAWYVYRVLGDPATGDFGGGPVPGQQIVSPSDVSVISPTPTAAPEVPPSGAYLTLTTCHPRYSARERLIVHAVLEGGPVLRADAPGGPPALQEG
ncbi:class E sortase [Trujillonella endophytica]|uniref:Sortase A n=1 Tax=Trujillonella endophytica TaxID=673521 RepID=A0A1H8PI29_9ACTN|nr:class E sortase [Trujillella endophytica]SEO41213.1 sortase A [Trujillella endophytica]